LNIGSRFLNIFKKLNFKKKTSWLSRMNFIVKILVLISCWTFVQI
jgi:hypothetical protein